VPLGLPQLPILDIESATLKTTVPGTVAVVSRARHATPPIVVCKFGILIPTAVHRTRENPGSPIPNP